MVPRDKARGRSCGGADSRFLDFAVAGAPAALGMTRIL
jgi:hypothetical protein